MKYKNLICYFIVALLSVSSLTAQEQLWKGTFDGWDFGFRNRQGTPGEFWKIKPNGELHATGGNNYNRQSGMRTGKTYSNYELTLEYKWLTPGSGDFDGNSGIWIHGENNWNQDNGGYPNSIEVQLKKGEAGDLLRKGMDITSESGFPNIGVRNEQLPRRNNNSIQEYFDGRWNKMTIKCEEDKITVFLNGLLINIGSVHKNGNAITSGYITLQSELKDLAFKNIFIKELESCNIYPNVSVNNGKFETGDLAEITIGDSVRFLPSSNESVVDNKEGTWSWTGPNNFSHNAPELQIENIQENQLGIYTVTHIAKNGCTSKQVFEVRTITELVAGTYYFKNVKTGLYLDADPNSVIKQGSALIDDDTKWNLLVSTKGYFFIDNGMKDRGPLAASSTIGNQVFYETESALNTTDSKREWQAEKVKGNIYKFLCKDRSRGILGVMVSNGKVVNRSLANDNGFTEADSQWELIFIKGIENCSIYPNVSVNKGKFETGDLAEITIGDSVHFLPSSNERIVDNKEGTWSWAGPNNFSHNAPELQIENIQENQLGTYTVTHINKNGCTSIHAFEIRTKAELVAGTYYFKNVKTGLYLDADPNSVIKQGSALIDDDTKWNLLVSTKGYFFIDNGMKDRGPLAASSTIGNQVFYEPESALNITDSKREWQAEKVKGNIYKFLCKDRSKGILGVMVSNGKVVNRPLANDNGFTEEDSQWELISVSNTQKNANEIALNNAEVNNNKILVATAPNNGSFTVHFNERKISDLVIYNTTGQDVYKKSFGEQGAVNTLSVSQNFVPGMYVLLVTDINGNKTSTKFIIN